MRLNELDGFLLFDVAEVPNAQSADAPCFAFPVEAALQAIEPEGVTRVPLSPPVVDGILSHQGRIITVVDPAPLLGLDKQRGMVAQAVILRQRRRRAANLALRVASIRAIVPRGDLQRVEVEHGPCIEWVGQRGRGLVHVVQLEALRERLGAQFDTEGLVSGQGVHA